MTIRSLRIAVTLLCTLPLILSACGGGDTPEDTAADTAQDQPAAAADARAPKQKPAVAGCPRRSRQSPITVAASQSWRRIEPPVQL